VHRGIGWRIVHIHINHHGAVVVSTTGGCSYTASLYDMVAISIAVAAIGA